MRLLFTHKKSLAKLNAIKYWITSNSKEKGPKKYFSWRIPT